jgi:hypothetical protein
MTLHDEFCKGFISGMAFTVLCFVLALWIVLS